MEAKVTKVWIEDEAVKIQTEDGKVYSELFADYPLLRNAAPAQRAIFEYNEFGIYWSELDEDLSFAGFIQQKKQNISFNHPTQKTI